MTQDDGASVAATERASIYNDAWRSGYQHGVTDGRHEILKQLKELVKQMAGERPQR